METDLIQYLNRETNNNYTSFNNIPWFIIIKDKPFDPIFISTLREHISWCYVCRYYELPEDFIITYYNYIDWDTLSQYQQLSKEFIVKNNKKINFYYLSYNRKITNETYLSAMKFIDSDNKENVDWYTISKNRFLTEEFIHENQMKLDWETICKYQKLSEEFILKHILNVDWEEICKYQKLSEEFIWDNKDILINYWNVLLKYQKVSESLILKLEPIITKIMKYPSTFWDIIIKYQKLSPSLFKKISRKPNTIDNWLYKSIKEKKKDIIDLDMFECHKDYFIAYKGIRGDRYSNYNFQFQYLKGETYECHADYTPTQNSFGLSAWTEEYASDYCDELVIKVKIYYKDVARIVHRGGKVRCSKFKVLS